MIEAAVAGLVTGAAYAVIGLCVVVLFSLTGVLNFSQAAIGSIGVFATYVFADSGLQVGAAAILGVVISMLLGLVSGAVLGRWFGDASVAIRSAVTIALLLLILAIGFRVFGDDPRIAREIVPAVGFDIGGVVVSATALVSVGFSMIVGLGATLLLSGTHLGLRLRAIAERPITAELLGMNAKRLTTIVWTAVAGISAVACLLVAPTQNATFGTMSFLIVPALAAGLIGGFRRIWVTIAAGLAMGAVEGVGARIDAVSSMRGAIPFVVIIVALLWVRRRDVWDAAR